jgi:hypothetical protein
MNLEKVFNRKRVKEEAEKTPLTIGEMQGMFHDYGIRVFNTETNELEIATMHNATTADLLRVIKYYEDNLIRISKEYAEEQQLLQLQKEIREIADGEFLPDGDSVNIPTLLWAENWVRIFDEIAPLATEEGMQEQLLSSANKMVKQALNTKIADIIWEKRYSVTEADDGFGRWMRIGRINDMTVAIITKAVHLEKTKYVVKLPNNKGDESLQSDIIVNSENEAMLEAEKFIAGYVANFRKMEAIGK